MTDLKSTQSGSAYARNTAAGGLLGSIIGAGADRLMHGKGRVGGALGAATGAAVGALHSKAVADNALATAHNREELHKLRKRNDERAADAHLVRHTMLRHALGDAQKGGDPEYAKNLEKLKGRINAKSTAILRDSEKVALLSLPPAPLINAESPNPIHMKSSIPGVDAHRENVDQQRDWTIVGPTTMDANLQPHEKMTAPKWKRTMRDAAVAVAGTAAGYGLGRTATEVTEALLGPSRFARAAPAVAAGAGALAGLYHDELRHALFANRQQAQRIAEPNSQVTAPSSLPTNPAREAALAGKRPVDKVAAILNTKVPKPKKTDPWKDSEADSEMWGEWG